MHAEHAELISALRAEVEQLNHKLARMGELQAIIDAQDRLLAVADRESRRIMETLERQETLILELRVRLGEHRTE
jgi:cell division septum initiation protein DivIVA